jgi:hypothetical protein
MYDTNVDPPTKMNNGNQFVTKGKRVHFICISSKACFLNSESKSWLPSPREA